MNGKEAEDKDIALVHTKAHIDLIRNISSKKIGLKRNKIAAKFNSIYFNEGSSEAAYLSAGSVIQVKLPFFLGNTSEIVICSFSY